MDTLYLIFIEFYSKEDPPISDEERSNWARWYMEAKAEITGHSLNKGGSGKISIPIQDDSDSIYLSAITVT